MKVVTIRWQVLRKYVPRRWFHTYRLAIAALLFCGGPFTSLFGQDQASLGVSTFPATPIGASTAKLHGTVTAGAENASVFFEFSTEPSLANPERTSDQLVPASVSPTPVQADITFLNEATTYYFRVVAWNDTGTISGDILSLDTGFPGGTVADALSETTAQLPPLTQPPNFPRVTRHWEFVRSNTWQHSPDGTLTNLQPGATYRYRSVTVIHQPFFPHEISQPDESRMFITAGRGAGSPSAIHLQPSDITDRTATLRGRAHARGGAAEVYFEYSYGYFPSQGQRGPLRATSVQQLANSEAWIDVSAPVVDLPPGTVIVYRLIARNAAGETRSDEIAFVTTSGGPSATQPATSLVRPTTATLESHFTTGGFDATAFFEYSTHADFAAVAITAVRLLEGGSTLRTLTEELRDLLPETTYYVRAVISTNSDTVRSQTGSFVSHSLEAPDVEVLAPSRLGLNSTTLRASVHPHGFPTTIEFFIDGVNRGSVAAASADGPVIVELPVSGLSSSTTYRVTAFARNSEGIVEAAPSWFRTIDISAPPFIQTLAVRNISDRGAILSAEVYPSGQALLVTFSVNDSPVGMVNVAGSETLIVDFPVTGLSPDTTYVVRTSLSVFGEVSGGSVEFRTLTRGGPPTATTIVPEQIDRSSAVLRAAVQGNGFATTVEFFVDGMSKGKGRASEGERESIIKSADKQSVRCECRSYRGTIPAKTYACSITSTPTSSASARLCQKTARKTVPASGLSDVPARRDARHHDALCVDHFSHHPARAVRCRHENRREAELLRRDFLQIAEEHVRGGIAAGERDTEPADER